MNESCTTVRAMVRTTVRTTASTTAGTTAGTTGCSDEGGLAILVERMHIGLVRGLATDAKEFSSLLVLFNPVLGVTEAKCSGVMPEHLA